MFLTIPHSALLNIKLINKTYQFNHDLRKDTNYSQDLGKDTNCSVNIRKFLSKIHHI